MKKIIAALSTFVFSFSAYSADIVFDQLDGNDMKNIVGDFSGNFSHTSVAGATPLGDILGFEVGLIGGVTDTPKIKKLVNEQDPSVDASQMPHAALLGRVSVPFGITGEIGLVPKVGSDSFKFQNISIAAMWTPTSFLLELPLSLAAKLHYTKTTVNFKQPVGTPAVNTDIQYENGITGFDVIASKDFIVVEPYLGLGYLSGSGKLSVSGNTTIFDTTFSTSQSATASKGSFHLFGGAELKLLFFKIGLEFGTAFGTTRYTAKLSGAF